MSVHVASLVGEPRVQLVMWDPANRSNYWHSPGLTPLKLGHNYVSLGGRTERETWFTYAIALGKGDAVRCPHPPACTQRVMIPSRA